MGVSILPAIDVATYTPYLISVDLCRAVGEIGREADHIFINLDAGCFPKEYIDYTNLRELLEHINDKLKGLQKKPRLWLRHQKIIFSQEALNTE